MIKRSVKWLARNLLGYALFIAGFIMLFTPGQGLLTMLAGMAIADWPGRHRFFTWLRTYRKIEELDEWIERKFKVRLPGDPPAKPTADSQP